ncbi:MAG TPA: hypothetical protein VGO85_12915 [Caldimonas sp.]|jgi:hypothetical protein|nr:hypothetical protein [Caldimonas sp.]
MTKTSPSSSATVIKRAGSRRQVAAPVSPSLSPTAGNAPGHVLGGKGKSKLVRDSYTIPKAEYDVLVALKLRAADLKRPTKKSELLRAGIVALEEMTDKALLALLGRVPSLKTGRPRSEV